MKKIFSIILSICMLISLTAGLDYSAYAEGTTTLTIHWSSIDGVDLVEPIVFENVNANSTVNEVLENAGRQSNQKFFAEEGYTELGMLYTKPMSEYSELGNKYDYANLIRISAETKNTKIGENGLDVYTAEYKVITDDVVAEIQNPVCGTSTTTPKDENGEWQYEAQTNTPIVSLPKNVHYRLMGEYEIGLPIVLWADNSEIKENPDPYIGDFEGNKDYYAFVLILAEYGYMFPNEGSKLIVNGTQVTNASVSRVGAMVAVSVTAKHNAVTDKAVAPTFKNEGKTGGTHCSGCGKVIIKQQPISKLGFARISKTVRGKKKLTVKWKEVSGVDGYEIQYSRKKNMKKAKKKIVYGEAKNRLVIKNLKSKRRYYVRIRAYKLINGKKVYSAWSAKKKVKTK